MSPLLQKENRRKSYEKTFSTRNKATVQTLIRQKRSRKLKAKKEDNAVKVNERGGLPAKVSKTMFVGDNMTPWLLMCNLRPFHP